MEKILSFTGLEKQVLHEFRKRVNLSEDSLDLEQLFRHIIEKIFKSESLVRMNINVHDFVFDPDQQEGYRLSDHLLNSEAFRRIYDNSDLRHVIGRFAQPISKRYTHLKKNPRRSDNKIR